MSVKKILTRYLDTDVLNAILHQRVEPHELVEGNLAGAHRSPLHGFAVEFFGHREYVPGDDPRHIDWRVVYARDKDFVKQYELETNFVCNLLLDVSASMNYGEEREQKLFYAQQLVALLAYCVVQQGDKVSLISFDTEIRQALPPGNSFDQIVRILQVLDETECREKTDFVASLESATDRMGRREIAILFSDFLTTDLERLEATLQHLRYQRHQVVLFQIAHRDELEFPLSGMVRFEGLEDGDEVLAQTEDIRRNYVRIVREFTERLHDMALRNHCEHMLVDTSHPIREVLVDYFE